MCIATAVTEELTAARERLGISQENVANDLHYTRQMMQMVEAGKRRLHERDTARLTRKLNDGALALCLARRVTGGMMVGPYLDQVEDHRLVAVLKLLEELQEAQGMLQDVLPVVLRAQGSDSLTAEEADRLKATCLEIVESITAAENTLARIARAYGISLADLWDEHERELVEKGYLRKSSAPRAGR